MSAFDLGVHSRLDPPRWDGDPACDGQVLVVDQTGDVWTIQCGKCGWEAGLPARKANPELQRQMREQRAGFPPRFLNSRFDETPENRNALAALRAWVSGYDRQQGVCSLLPAPAIHGLQGRGKTLLLVQVCRGLIRKHDLPVMFRSVSRLLDEVQAGFDRPVDGRGVWDLAVSVDVLALDDVGAEQATDWRADRLARLVDERYERELPVVVATNYRPGDWERVMDQRTWSRLLGMTFRVELRGVDRRQLAMGDGSIRSEV